MASKGMSAIATRAVPARVPYASLANSTAIKSTTVAMRLFIARQSRFLHKSSELGSKKVSGTAHRKKLQQQERQKDAKPRTKRPPVIEPAPYEPATPKERVALYGEFTSRWDPDDHSIDPRYKAYGLEGVSRLPSEPLRRRHRRFFELRYLDERDQLFRRASGDKTARPAKQSLHNVMTESNILLGQIHWLENIRRPVGSRSWRFLKGFGGPPQGRVSLEELDEYKSLKTRNKALIDAINHEIGFRGMEYPEGYDGPYATGLVVETSISSGDVTRRLIRNLGIVAAVPVGIGILIYSMWPSTGNATPEEFRKVHEQPPAYEANEQKRK